MIFEISNPHTGHIYDDRVSLDKAIAMIAGDKDENEQQLTQLKEDNEILCRSKHIPSFKLTLKKVPLGDLLHT
jgi:hypothetical protein